MTTPPDFGGTEIEKGRQEEFGITPEGHEDSPDALTGLTAKPHADNDARAPGQTCARCGRVLQPDDEVRRRADGRWVHETCPASAQLEGGGGPS